MSDAKFDWGAVVRTLPEIPLDFRPRERGWVCGIRKLSTEAEAGAVGFPIGTIVYVVEFEDGTSIEMPEEFLAEVGE